MKKSKDLLVSGMGIALSLIQGLMKYTLQKGLTNEDIHWLSRQQDPDVEKTLEDMSVAMVDVLQKAKSRIGRTFTIIRGGNRTTEEVIGATEHTYINRNINSQNFPLTQGPEDERELVAFQLEYDPDFDDLIKELMTRGLEQPIPEDALKFDEAHSSKKGVYVFPHKPWKDPDGNLQVLVVGRADAQRQLALYYAVNRWGRRCWCVGVRPRK